MGLRTKILLIIFTFQALVFGFLTVIFALEEARRAQIEMKREGELLGRVITDWIQHAGSSGEIYWGSLKEILDQSTRSRDGLLADYAIVAIGTDGRAEVKTSFGARTFSEVLENEERTRRVFETERITASGQTVYVPVMGPVINNAPTKFVAILELKPEASTKYGPALDGLIIAMTMGTIFLLLVTYIYINRVVLRPLSILISSAARVADGDFSRRMPENAAYDEMATLLRTFNAMTMKMEQYQRELQDEIRKAQQKITHTERSLFHAQRLTTTGTLAAGIAHEINNPLGGMMNAARKLQEGNLDPERQRQYVELISEGLERIRVIVQQVLQFRPKPFEPQAVAVREVVEKSIAFLDHRAKGRGVEVRNETRTDLPTVNGDPLELQQAFLNVLMNAVDACKPQEGMVTIYAKQESGAMRVSVADNGSGMDERTMARCMDPFFTTKEVGEGTGLGLSVANNILENHGGRLEIASSPGRGTTVTFILPITNGLQKDASSR